MTYRTNKKLVRTGKWLAFLTLLGASTLLLIPDLKNIRSVFLQEMNVQYTGRVMTPVYNWRNLSTEQIGKMSTLGKILFLEEIYPIKNHREQYKILIWKYASTLENRHIKHFTDKRFDPFEKCPVKNCKLAYNDTDLNSADAVLFHLQRIKGLSDLPNENRPRLKNQRWIFLTDETPFHTFFQPNLKLASFNGKFNWSMTYRLDADIPVPYGRTITHNQSIFITQPKTVKRNDVLIAILGSNCGGKNNRWKYVKELQKHINVHVYGRCGTLSCPGHFNQDCDKIAGYKFYLSFENSNCAQYITEKLWWNAYNKDSIPIVMGAKKIEYKQLLPPKSYIHVDDFAGPADLARYVIYVNKTEELYKSYFEWKYFYSIRNEHGYFQSESVHYCRICEALNYNSKESKVYSDLQKFWSTKDCYPSWDEVTDD